MVIYLSLTFANLSTKSKPNCNCIIKLNIIFINNNYSQWNSQKLYIKDVRSKKYI